MIEPSGIPHFSGNLEQLDLDVSALRSDAIGIRNGGRDVHARFQALEGVYKAPEAGQLFATTRPVMDKAETFATNLETVADALDTFSIEARPLAKKLAQLKADALAFVESVKGDDEWTDDEDKINQHQELLDGVSAARAAFQESENRAASKISAIVGGPKFVFDDGSHTANDKTVMYGNDLDTLKSAEELPWGVPVSETGFGYWAKSYFWDGLIVDNIGGGLKGLGTLVGIGDDDTSDAWSHLWDVVGGIGQYTATPYNWLLDQALGEEPKDPEVEKQKQATRDFGKALVGWDMWDENPARAAATVTFTVLTLGSGALATAAKAGSGGALAKTAGAASKVGTWIDPLSAGLKVTGKAVGSMPRLSEVTASIRSAFDTTATSQRLHSVIELENGSKVVIRDGEFIPLDANGKINTATPHQEAPAGAHATPEEVPARRDLAAVGAHPRAHEASAHAGENPPPRASHEALVRDGSNTPRGMGDTAGGSGAGALPSRAGTSPTARFGDNVPGQRGGGSGNGAHGDYTGPSRWNGASPEEIMRHQVHRANNEPGYFERYYKTTGKSTGYRKFADIPDESGLVPPQLIPDPHNPGRKISIDDAPPPIPEKYIAGGDVTRTPKTVSSPDSLKTLNDAAQTRHTSVTADNLFHKTLSDAADALKADKSQANIDALKAAEIEHKPLHESMTKDTEAYGEAIAEHHVIPEHYPNATRETLAGPKNGNDQFDQLWRREDGGYVVVEAKSNVRTELGKRNLPDGFSARQGSKEYFLDILNEMRERGLNGNANETRLYNELLDALEEGKVDYILVKGKPNTGTYAGYYMRRFNLG
ncbi:hypothetical protein [Streptomyces flavidovirens]|uniref:Uncharacterized protein n=1 Tax=Streptomyces flavidovirens TaxID=67298 RepID=A0ABW6R8M8_9ACTN